MREGIKRTPMELLRAVIEEQGREMPCGTLHELHGDEQNICNDRNCIECGLDALRKAADLVEEELDALKARALPEGMEWPMFEDGEPVKFGDMALIDGDADMVEAVQLWIHGKPVIYGDNGSQQLEKGERVKRPAPKVLDADGVEIREGDTVYRVGMSTFDPEYNTLTVTDIRTKPGLTPIETKNSHDGYLYGKPEDFTHRAPVIAADGKPLREGETVYLTDSTTAFVVDDIMTREDGATVVHLRDGAWHLPQYLTHERPDSWERLEEDAGKEACEYFAHMPCGCETSEMLEETVEKCNAAKARDLVRRAKKLAERGGR